jgi:hypothetical protein
MGSFSELVVAQGPCADPTFLRMMEDLEAGYQDPDQQDILHTYGAIMRHIIQSLSTVMSMSPEQSLRHMLMSCVQQQLEHQVGLPLGSTSTPVTRYSESDSHKLADMIKLAMVAISSQYNCTVTPEGLKEALLGPDFLGLRWQTHHWVPGPHLHVQDALHLHILQLPLTSRCTRPPSQQEYKGRV